MKLKGNTIVWTYAVATWLWFGSTAGWSSTLEDNYTYVKEYRTFSFTTKDATDESYTRIVTDVRDYLPIDHLSHGIPVLRHRDAVPVNERYVLIALTNGQQHTITLALDVTNVYLVGYRAGNRAYFFDHPRDFPDAPNHLFRDIPDSNRYSLPFESGYPSLEFFASGGHGSRREPQPRTQFNLGMESLEDAISALYYHTTGRTQTATLARSFIVLAQMFPEAIRFHSIMEAMAMRIQRYENSPPGQSLVALENRFGSFSTEIQAANDAGGFNRPVPQQNDDYTSYSVTNAREVISIIALLIYNCPERQQSHQFPLHIRQVGPNIDDDDDVCRESEPTMRIKGPNGLCVDVLYERYGNGNPIGLWTCKCNREANQLWTFKRDGTIRSNGMCLTTYGYSPGSYIMIYECSSAVTGATRWQVCENGTIVNPRSGLVLASKAGEIGSELRVETNIYSIGQGWLPSNNTQTFVTSIVGIHHLCLQATSGNVWLEKCERNKAEQRWALYPDGSIRPQQNQNDNCLTGDPNDEGGIVKIKSCNLVSSSQRWIFKNDRTIWNLNYGMVLDVRKSNPSLKQILIYTFTGNPNQKWSTLL